MGNEEKLLPKQYKRRFEVTEIDPDDLEAVLDMGISSLKASKAKYPETVEGLEMFKQATLDYFSYVQQCNKDDNREHKLIPDVEGLSVYLGITRRTLLTYEKTRSDEWKDFISRAKDLITATKKQLIFRQKIPAVVGIFDLCNNSNYVNSSEFRLLPETDSNKSKTLDSEDIKAMLAKKENMEIEVIETNVSNEF